ncbi:DNA-3-methyladenine glycosylase [Candidatus Fermentibacteria bacterium]|nr:MAG: DNA-3-methyladenine glycosylase [Candidatus Fermentibacteria bacterium]
MYVIISFGNRRSILRNYKAPPAGFFSRDAVIVAPDLIDCLLRRRVGGGFISGVIVETEAYTQDDSASHSFRGPTLRNRFMFERGGLAYVYLIYGVHNCFNVTTGVPGSGEAVLIRAAQPLEGIELMQANRGKEKLMNLCSGPGKLSEAFGIDRNHNGISLEGGEIQVLVHAGDSRPDVSVSKRVGISRGADLRRRFTLKESGWVSRR